MVVEYEGKSYSSEISGKLNVGVCPRSTLKAARVGWIDND